MTTIRPMVRDDLPAVLRLQTATPEAPQWNLDIYENFLTSGSFQKQGFVALTEPSLVGFAVVRIVADVCELESIVVAGPARRHRVGSSLLKSVTDWAQAHQAIRVELEVRSRNASAVGFYEAACFQKDGLRRRYYQAPEDDAVLMSLALNSRA